MNIDIKEYISTICGIIHYHGNIKGNTYILMTDITDINQFKYAVDNANRLDPNTKLGFNIKRLKGGEFKQDTIFDATPSLIEKMFNYIKPLNDKWYGIKYFLDAMIEDRKKYVTDSCCYKPTFHSLDENIDYCLSLMRSSHSHYLHKKQSYGYSESKFQPIISDKFFKSSDHDKMNMLIQACPCLGSYNARVVLEFEEATGFDKYGTAQYEKRYVGINYDDLIDKFLVKKTSEKKDKNGNITQNTKLDTPSDDNKKVLKKALNDYCDELFSRKKEAIGHNRDRYSHNYIMYDNNPNYTEEHISDKIRELWDVKLGGLDVRTGTSLTDSYMTMLGWYFSPVKMGERLCGSFYSPSSGIGKTAIIEALCKKTDIVHATISQTNGSANQFSFTGALAIGPDIIQCDDPMKGTDDVLNMVSTLVTNKKFSGEFKGKDRILLSNLNTKVLITSNVPLYMKNDSNNFLTQKLFELQTNMMGHLTDGDNESSQLVEYIDGCKTPEIGAFINKCVKMYNDNPGWIRQHLGQYMDSDDEYAKFSSLLDLNKVMDKNNKTLIECVRDDVKGYDVFHNNQPNKEIQNKWHSLCKYINNKWVDIVDECAACTPRDNNIFFSSTYGLKNPRNYKLKEKFRNRVIDVLSVHSHDDECDNKDNTITEISKKYDCDGQETISADELYNQFVL